MFDPSAILTQAFLNGMATGAPSPARKVLGYDRSDGDIYTVAIRIPMHESTLKQLQDMAHALAVSLERLCEDTFTRGYIELQYIFRQSDEAETLHAVQQLEDGEVLLN